MRTVCSGGVAQAADGEEPVGVESWCDDRDCGLKVENVCNVQYVMPSGGGDVGSNIGGPTTTKKEIEWIKKVKEYLISEIGPYTSEGPDCCSP